MEVITKVVTGCLTVILTIFLIGAITALPIMWTWNYVMPDVFGLPELNFWQAFWGGLMMKFLIGGGSGK